MIWQNMQDAFSFELAQLKCIVRKMLVLATDMWILTINQAYALEDMIHILASSKDC